MVAKYPELEDELRVPQFHNLCAEKIVFICGFFPALMFVHCDHKKREGVRLPMEKSHRPKQDGV